MPTFDSDSNTDVDTNVVSNENTDADAITEIAALEPAATESDIGTNFDSNANTDTDAITEIAALEPAATESDIDTNFDSNANTDTDTNVVTSENTDTDAITEIAALEPAATESDIDTNFDSNANTDTDINVVTSENTDADAITEITVLEEPAAEVINEPASSEPSSPENPNSNDIIVSDQQGEAEQLGIDEGGIKPVEIKKGFHSAYLMRKETTATDDPLLKIVRDPYFNLKQADTIETAPDALVDSEQIEVIQRFRTDDPLDVSGRLTFENDGSQLTALINFEDGRSGDSNDNIRIPLRRIVTESQAFPSLEIGYYEPDPEFNNWKSTNGNEYRFLESRFSFAEGFVTPLERIAELTNEQAVFDYQGLASGEIYFNGIESSCDACGQFQGTIDFGKSQVRDFRINFDTGRAFANIQTGEATLNSDGSFTFTDQQGSYSINSDNTDPVTTSGVVNGAVFGKDAESVGGTVNLISSPVESDAYATGRFGGNR